MPDTDAAARAAAAAAAARAAEKARIDAQAALQRAAEARTRLPGRRTATRRTMNALNGV